MDIWGILGIKATTDIAAIKKAYAERARECHPEEDPQGFQVLHEAFAAALESAKRYGDNTSDGKEETPPANIGFRPAPKELRKLGQAASADDPEAVPKKGPALEEAELPEAVYKFPDPAGAAIGLEENEDRAGGYSFPRGVTVNKTSAEETPQENTACQFPKSGPAEPPAPQQANDAGNAPVYTFCPPAAQPAAQNPSAQEAPASQEAYVFPRDGAADAPPQEEAQIQEHLENAQEYRFPKANPDPALMLEQAGSRQGAAAGRSGGAVVFPGFAFLDGMAEADMPFMPWAIGSSQEHFPQTPEDAERLRLLENARVLCLDSMQNLLDRNAPEQDWYPVLLGVDFALVQHDRNFLLKLLDLCRQRLTLEMASALYMAYGFASDKSLRKYPATATLYAVLHKFLQLPQDTIPLQTLSESLHKSDMVLAGLARITTACAAPYVCGQAVRTPAFVQVRRQPYFIRLLAAFLEQNEVAAEWRQALALAYGFTEPPASTSLQALAGQLPLATAPKNFGDYKRAADNLLLDEAALPAFLMAVREEVLDMLERTRKGFPQSTRREPWDYVFTRPEFAHVHLDWEFLVELLSFLQEKKLPPGIWPAMADAYSGKLAELAATDTAPFEPGANLTPEERTPACLLMLRDILESGGGAPARLPSFLEVLKSMFSSL